MLKTRNRARSFRRTRESLRRARLAARVKDLWYAAQPILVAALS